MEKIRDDGHGRLDVAKLKSETAIRCAKAAILLSSLKTSSRYSAASNISEIQIEETTETLKMEKLKLELMIWKLVKEKQKLRLWIRVGLLFYFLCVLVLLHILVLNFT